MMTEAEKRLSRAVLRAERWELLAAWEEWRAEVDGRQPQHKPSYLFWGIE